MSHLCAHGVMRCQVAEQNPELLGRINQQLQLLAQLTRGEFGEGAQPLPSPFQRSLSTDTPRSALCPG